MKKIEISTEFFLDIFRQKLTDVQIKLGQADEELYNNKEMVRAWENVRQSSLIISKLLEAIE